MAEPTVQDPKRTPRWVKILLGLSLALNLAIVGVVAGSALRFSKGPADGKRGFNGPAYFTALAPEDRRTLLRDMRRGRDNARAEQRDQMRALAEALRANEFDPEAAQNVLAAQSQFSRATRSSANTKWLEIVTNMSPQERADYADRLEQALERRPGKRRR